MQLTEEQKQKVAAWMAEGIKLSDLQSRLESELGIRLTYMEARFLMDDLKLTPRDPEPEKTAPESQALDEAQAPGQLESSPIAPAPAMTAGQGNVTLTTDTLARPGTVVSGSVTFSDGRKAAWHLDQTGRLGVVTEEQGYRPKPADVESFQLQLDRELQKLGL